MIKRTFSVLMLALLLTSLLTLTFNIQPAKSEPSTIIVPDDYTTIQEAINNASNGDTVFVKSGVYYENIVVNKTVSLIGENRNATIINGNSTDVVVYMTANNATISGLTIQHGFQGIKVDNCDNCRIEGVLLAHTEHDAVDANYANGLTVKDNEVNNCKSGLYCGHSVNASFLNNTIIRCETYGIIFYYCHNSTIAGNNIRENGRNESYTYRAGISLAYVNTHNNITENILWDNWPFNIWFRGSYPVELPDQNCLWNNNLYLTKAYVQNPSRNSWDNGYPSGGNYWSDYTGSDSFFGAYQNLTGSDGIGDTPYNIDANNVDHYPLMSPYEYWSNPILGDVNRDMKVNMGDITQLCDGFGSVNGSDGHYWHNPPCILCPHCPSMDIDKNKQVDMGDVTIALDNFGRHYP